MSGGAMEFDFDTTKPNVARMNDYYLGGKDNFAADREAAEQALAVAPEIRVMARDNVAFRSRVTRFLVGQGIRQFIAVATGLPTTDNIHQVAQTIAPDARVVYVDHDPVVRIHARALLATNPNTGVAEGHFIDPGGMLGNPELRRLIDLDQPTALMTFGILQFMPDNDDPFGCVAKVCDALPSGSYLAIAHVVKDVKGESIAPLVKIYQRVFGRPEDASRTREQVLRFFDGLELIEPGLVYIRQWRPDNPLAAANPEKAWVVGGVGRIP